MKTTNEEIKEKELVKKLAKNLKVIEKEFGFEIRFLGKNEAISITPYSKFYTVERSNTVQELFERSENFIQKTRKRIESDLLFDKIKEEFNKL